MPLRPLLEKDLILRASETGTKEDIFKALRCLELNQVFPQIEIVDFRRLNETMDQLRKGEVRGRLVIEMSSLN